MARLACSPAESQSLLTRLLRRAEVSVHLHVAGADAAAIIVELHVLVIPNNDMGTDVSMIFFEIIKAVSRWPKGLSCVPACQMETFSAFHVSAGPTEIALRGTPATFPPPEVRAFWTSVSGCRSTTRVVSCRYSSGVGGSFW